jgi:hypothetical protein
LPREIGMIGMMSFQIENQMIRFIYSSHSFEMVFRNNENMNNLEWNIKFKAGLGNDENLYDFGNRRILKGEMIFEHQNVILKRSDRKFETEECDLADLNVYIFISKIKIQTRARRFTGWNRKGLLNHIGRLVRMKNANLICIGIKKLKFSGQCGSMVNLIISQQFIKQEEQKTMV